MSSGCTSSAAVGLGCVEAQGRPVRATYRNLYKWPESDAEFVKSVSRGGGGGDGWCEQRRQRRRGPGGQYQQPRVVDSYSCRQMYLRSYTFSKKETVPERTKKCLGRVKERVSAAAANVGTVPGCVPLWVSGSGGGKRGDDGVGTASAGGGGGGGGGAGQRMKTRGAGVRRLRDASSAAFCSIFHRLLSCTASVEVVDR